MRMLATCVCVHSHMRAPEQLSYGHFATMNQKTGPNGVCFRGVSLYGPIFLDMAGVEESEVTKDILFQIPMYLHS